MSPARQHRSETLDKEPKIESGVAEGRVPEVGGISALQPQHFVIHHQDYHHQLHTHQTVRATFPFHLLRPAHALVKGGRARRTRTLLGAELRLAAFVALAVEAGHVNRDAAGAGGEG